MGKTAKITQARRYLGRDSKQAHPEHLCKEPCFEREGPVFVFSIWETNSEPTHIYSVYICVWSADFYELCSVFFLTTWEMYSRMLVASLIRIAVTASEGPHCSRESSA